ncbi:unnamed protein product [Adineta ricciae]|uniref:L-Fucosyltransferase n=1 Tax=Adineta ricciae TaxID=249248 RepID=A0A814BW73_ADIRI|nr:unnamed protein product [Adineta ricciae]CAF1111637.1 unnamed protein product [Adineta ricciae]
MRSIINSSLKQCTIILRERSGRLGNRLFMFASAYGLSLNQSYQLYIDSDIIKELNKSFNINLSNLISKSKFSDLKFVKKIYNHCTYFSQIFSSNSSSIQLSGFWQVYKHFYGHREQIKQQLTFKSSIFHRINHFLNKTVNRTNSIIIGIHIRRGDFLLVRRVSSDKYIFTAMSYFQLKYVLVKFIIVSDDKSYCQQRFAHQNNVFITPNSFSATDDLALLTRCDHLIITAGTFGWWSAFLLHNQFGEVISDSKVDGTPIDANCRREDYFPPWFSFLNNTN